MGHFLLRDDDDAIAFTARWTRRIVLAAVAIGVPVLVVGLVMGRDRDLGLMPWSLHSISEDARTIVIAHDSDFCAVRSRQVELKETESAVTIAVPQYGDRRFLERKYGPCIAIVPPVKLSEVRLAQPLGGRELPQPPNRNESHRPGVSTLYPTRESCKQHAAYPADAPARDVPAVKVLLRTCDKVGLP